LESVGRLAGVVADDFGNLLAVINGFPKTAVDDLSPESAVRENLSEVLTAAERAAGLTRHFLAFSRKQRIQPNVLSIPEAGHGRGIGNVRQRCRSHDGRTGRNRYPFEPLVQADFLRVVRRAGWLNRNSRRSLPVSGWHGVYGFPVLAPPVLLNGGDIAIGQGDDTVPASTKGTGPPQNFSMSGRAWLENPVERNFRRPSREPSYSGCRSRYALSARAVASG